MREHFFPAPEGAGAATGQVRERSAIEERHTWRLEDLFETDEAWEAGASEVTDDLPRLEALKGHLGESADTLLEALTLRDSVSCRVGALLAYAFMRRDEQTSRTEAQALADRATALYVRTGGALSWMAPELLALDEERVRAFLDEKERLGLYRFFFEELFRARSHVLSAPEEALLAGMGEMAQTADNVFSMLTNADMRFPVIKDEKGIEVELSEERYSRFLRSQDRRVRREAFEGILGTYKNFRNTLAASYGGSVKHDLFVSRARGYGSCLEAALDGNAIPLSVYHNTVETVRRRLDALHRYVTLRKKVLAVDELHMYDLYVPLVADVDKTYDYEEALDLVRRGLRPLGDDYGALLDEGFRNRWIDVYENRGKRSGAYSWGNYGVHPYVLLNYGGTIRDVFTIAHEMGHALHRFYSDRDQPYVYSSHTIFLAEVASTTNEALLLRHLLDEAKDDRERLYLLNYSLEQIRTTLFRQTLFAEFELEVHGRAETGEPLTPESLETLWMELNRAYYGPAVVDDLLAGEWSRIPHFYNAFYVYQYATGYASALYLSKKIVEEGIPALERYRRFLSRGSSAHSIEILRDAGVDMTLSAPMEAAIDIFEDHLTEMEKLVAAGGHRKREGNGR